MKYFLWIISALFFTIVSLWSQGNTPQTLTAKEQLSATHDTANRLLPPRLQHIDRFIRRTQISGKDRNSTKHNINNIKSGAKYMPNGGNPYEDQNLPSGVVPPMSLKERRHKSMTNQVANKTDARRSMLQQNAAVPTPFINSTHNDSVLLEWSAIYTCGLNSSYDSVYAIATDEQGNVYVTGSSCLLDTVKDFLTIKYNSSGIEQWIAQYNGPGSGVDEAFDICVDILGNVFVTGVSTGADTTYDYVTIKYNSTGVQQWVTHYGGPGSGDDVATAICVDTSGAVYVTGFSKGADTTYDYATIKYNSSGVEQWVSRFTVWDDDIATGLCIDKSGNVYVTGYCFDPMEWRRNWGCATIVYDNLGNYKCSNQYWRQEWEDCKATDLCIDNSRNIYVTGYINNGYESNYLTIKYNSSCEQQWIAEYDGWGSGDDVATAICVDHLGFVYITGYSWDYGTLFDYTTIKYDSLGAEQWDAHYNGPGNRDDVAVDIGVDNGGNIYVVGKSSSNTIEPYNYDFATVKYDSAGVEQWIELYNGPGDSDDEANAISVDTSGNVYIAGSSFDSDTYSDFTIIKYNSSGAEKWISRYNVIGPDYDLAADVDVDTSGNVYITGRSYRSGMNSDYATIKYNSSGVEQWIRRYNNPGNGDDEPVAIAVDGEGNVYVTGYSSGDCATLKYNSSGVEQWVRRYNGNEPVAMALDGSGNVYVAGYGGGDYATIKYNSSGVEQWVRWYNGPGNRHDVPVAIALDGQGNVYVTGSSYGSVTDEDFAIVKYNSSGNQQWVARYNGPGNYTDEVYASCVDVWGNVYVTGRSYGSGSDFDCATIKYNNLGIQQWIARDDDATFFLLDIDDSGNVYIAGHYINKYNNSGILQWTADNGISSTVTGLDIDDWGYVYLTGYYTGGEKWDCETSKYNSSGVPQWISRYDGPGNSWEYPTAIAVDEDGNVYLTGWTAWSNSNLSGYEYMTLKYRQCPQFFLSQTALLFDTAAVSCRTENSVVVHNEGQVPLRIISASSDDLNFIVNSGTAIINPEDSLIFTITFAPLSGGTKSGNIILIHNGESSPDTIAVTGTATVEEFMIMVNVQYGTEWQMLSLPVEVKCSYLLYGLFSFDGSYTPRDTMENGLGYWKKMGTTNHSFVGYPDTSDTVTLRPGWNMIGSISTPVLKNTLITIPEDIIVSDIFGYGGLYFSADTITPGRAYWVKANQAGQLVLSSSGGMEKHVAIANPLEGLDKLTISDLEGKSQTLYVGTTSSGISPERYDMPPLPPMGGFDVRFGSNRMVEIFGDGKIHELPIQIISSGYPLTISWEFKSQLNVSSLFIDGQEIQLKTSGSIKLVTLPSKVVLRSTETSKLQKKYTLAQNYPNPFNPSTTIRYELPKASFVTLKVYNLLGQEVATLVNERKGAGMYNVEFNGASFPSGLYFYRIQANRYIETKKLLLLK